MRTSFNMLSTNYLKKNEEDVEEDVEPNIINNVQTTKTDNMQQQPTRPRDRKQYLNDYYEKNKQKIKEQLKILKKRKHIK